MNKTWYNIAVAEGSTEAEISIYDAIGGYDINAKQFVDELKAVDAETIHLRINSPGGSVIDGNAIFNALKRHSARVVVHIDGLAASMASVIAMAGEEIRMADNALMMIHNPWTITMGDADDLRKDADLLDKMRDAIVTAYSRSQYEPEELIAMMDEETWLTAQEALDGGFIDMIEDGLRAAASDFAAFAKSSGIEIPADKQIAALNKQVEALQRANEQLTEKWELEFKLHTEAMKKVADAEAEIESAELAKAEAEELAKKIEGELEAKEAEIEEAKKATEAAVAQKAAELVQSSTHAPVSEDDEHAAKKDAEALMTEYNALTDHVARRKFRDEHKEQFSKLLKRG